MRCFRLGRGRRFRRSLMLLRRCLMLLRCSLMLLGGRLRRAFCVRGSSLTFWLCGWRGRYGFDLGARRRGFCGWLSSRPCRGVRRWRRGGVFGLCRWFCSGLALSRLVLV